jgi:hypothetical protein
MKVSEVDTTDRIFPTSIERMEVGKIKEAAAGLTPPLEVDIRPNSP